MKPSTQRVRVSHIPSRRALAAEPGPSDLTRTWARAPLGRFPCGNGREASRSTEAPREARPHHRRALAPADGAYMQERPRGRLVRSPRRGCSLLRRSRRVPYDVGRSRARAAGAKGASTPRWRGSCVSRSRAPRRRTRRWRARRSEHHDDGALLIRPPQRGPDLDAEQIEVVHPKACSTRNIAANGSDFATALEAAVEAEPAAEVAAVQTHADTGHYVRTVTRRRRRRPFDPQPTERSRLPSRCRRCDPHPGPANIRSCARPSNQPRSAPTRIRFVSPWVWVWRAAPAAVRARAAGRAPSSRPRRAR
jgi:hypothetical protein